MRFLFVLLLFFSCKRQDKKENVEVIRKVSVDFALKSFSKIQKENDTIIRRFEECINSDEFKNYDRFWDKSDTLFFKYPSADLYNTINQRYPTYLPTIMAIQKIENNKYLFKIAMMSSAKGFNSLDIIYNIYVIRDKDGQFVFRNMISENLASWKKKSIDNITYYYNEKRILNDLEIKNQLKFERYLIDFLGVEKINYKYIICENLFEVHKIAGYDYEDSMFFTEQSGGSAFPSQGLMFAGNNSAYYPHEIIHIYTHYNFPRIHSVMDEGFATFLGGSKGLNFTNHIEILDKYIKTNKISINEYLFDNSKRYTIIGSNSSIMYSVGAFLCDLTFKKFGKEGLFKLMDSGSSDEELKKAIETMFDVKMENFDDFINEELKKYNF